MEKRIILPSQERIWEKYYPAEALDFDFPRMKTYDLVYEQNRKNKDSIALEYCGREISYGEFFDKVDERTQFYKSLGVKPNDVLVMSMLMTPEFVYDWYALGRLNAISNLIDPRISVQGIKKCVEQSNAKYFVNTDLFLTKILKAIGKDPSKEIINHALAASADKLPLDLRAINAFTSPLSSICENFDKRVRNQEDEEITVVIIDELPEYIMNQGLTVVNTGGTTGTSKGVLLSHDNYNAMAWQYIISRIGFEPGDRFLLVMPPWISYGSGMLHMSLVRGMKSTIISKLNSKKFDSYILDYKPQWFAGVPAHYNKLAESKKIEKEGLSFLKAGAVGGDAVPAQLYDKANTFMVDNGASQGMYPGYAFTEVSSVLSVRQLGKFKPGSVGYPLPGATVGIFKYDEEKEITLDEELGYNEEGEICVQTPTQMLGYFKNDEETRKVIRTHCNGSVWVHSGDLGHIDEDGYLFVTGRIKEMIARHDGFKVYPNSIEKIINTHKAVDSCKVVGINDIINKEGCVPRAYIVLKPEYQKERKQVLKEIKSLCNLALAKYYTEYLTFEVMEKLPLTAIGKVDFKALQALGNSQNRGRARIRK